MAETWHSPRYWEEQLRLERLRLFDEFVDMALDGVISIDEAILGYRELTSAPEIEAA